MKKTFFLLLTLFSFAFTSYSQADVYDLESQNLHKKVRRVATNYYVYDDSSGGFILRSTDIKRYNDDGNLIESFYQYNGSYSKSSPTKKLYNYDGDGKLTGIQDISSGKKSFASDMIFTYDRKGNLVKKETVYKNGNRYITRIENDRKGRPIRIKALNKDNKLSSETSIRYKGDIRTEVRTSYSTTDGSIYGTYTTIYDDDVKKEYISNSKYSTTNTKYFYDREGNLISTTYKGKPNSSKYDYVYDKRDNWVKKHYRSGKYQYFYFREVQFDNGDVTGSSNFDSSFINQHGTFANVSVVPLKMKKTKKKNTDYKNVSFTPKIKNKTFNYDYAYIDKKLYKINGTMKIKSPNSSYRIKKNDTANFTFSFGGKTYNYEFYVLSTKKYDDKYEWIFKNDNGNKAIYWEYKKIKKLKDDTTGTIINAKGVYSIYEVGQPNMAFYIK